MGATEQIETMIDYAQFNSVAYNQTEDLDCSEDEWAEVEEILLVQSDDTAETRDSRGRKVVQFWGTNDEGSPWRIHVTVS